MKVINEGRTYHASSPRCGYECMTKTATVDCNVATGVLDSCGVVATSATEAGRLAALMATLSLCRSLLMALCMPCTRSVRTPQHVQHAMKRASSDAHAQLSLRLGAWGSVAPALRCTRLPTNGFIAKRLYYAEARGDAQVRRPRCPVSFFR